MNCFNVCSSQAPIGPSQKALAHGPRHTRPKVWRNHQVHDDLRITPSRKSLARHHESPRFRGFDGFRASPCSIHSRSTSERVSNPAAATQASIRAQVSAGSRTCIDGSPGFRPVAGLPRLRFSIFIFLSHNLIVDPHPDSVQLIVAQENTEINGRREMTYQVPQTFAGQLDALGRPDPQGRHRICRGAVENTSTRNSFASWSRRTCYRVC
jgi:hypothetical protein